MKLNLRLLRPDEPEWQQVDLPDTRDWSGVSVSAALQHLNRERDPDLAYLLSCRRGLCNVCAMRIDGVVTTACTTEVRDGMRIEPAKPALLLKDTVVEVSLVRRHRL